MELVFRKAEKNDIQILIDIYNSAFSIELWFDPTNKEHLELNEG